MSPGCFRRTSEPRTGWVSWIRSSPADLELLTSCLTVVQSGGVPVLPDYLAPSLRAVICGTAVADRSASLRHYYAGAGNEFWLLLHQAGLTAEFLGPLRDAEILRFGLGLTDLAKRVAASSDSLLRREDFDVDAFITKVERYEPAWVAFHGKGAAREVSRYLGHGRDISLGVQDWQIADARVFVLPSASGSNRDPNRLEGKSSRLAWFKTFARDIPVSPA